MKNIRKFLLVGMMLMTVLVVTVAPAAAKVNEYEGQHRIAEESEPQPEALSLNFAKIEYD